MRLITFAVAMLLSFNAFSQKNYEYRWKKISDEWNYDIYIDANSIQQSGSSYSYITMVNYKLAEENIPGFPVSYIRRGISNCAYQTVKNNGGLGYTKHYAQGPAMQAYGTASINISEADAPILVVYRYFCK